MACWTRADRTSTPLDTSALLQQICIAEVPAIYKHGLSVQRRCSGGCRSPINLGLVAGSRDRNSSRLNYFCGGRAGVVAAGFVGSMGMILTVDLNCLYSE